MPLEASLSLLRAQLAEADPTPETMRLLKAVWSQLADEERLDLLAQLGGIPSTEDVAGWSADDDLHARLLRQWRWLGGLVGQLPPDWEVGYTALSAEFGDADPEARRYRIGARFGTMSPMTAAEINDLGPERFASWAAAWRPSGRWDEPTPAGLRQELIAAVRESPSEWMGVLPQLAERIRHPTYVRAMLEGLHAVLKDGTAELDWQRIVALTRLVVSEPWPTALLKADPIDADPDWRECSRAALSLISDAAAKDADWGPDLIEQIWDTLVQLLRKRDRDAGVEDGRALTAAINKLSTRALETMFDVALNISRRKGDLHRWSEKLIEAVTEELEAGGEEARLAGVIVARLFPQFVHIVGNRSDAFVLDLFGEPDPSHLKSTAFETLVRWARPISDDLLLRFRPYLAAYLQLDPQSENGAQDEVVHWLTIGYLRQLAEWSDADKVLGTLTRPAWISEAAEFIGRVLRSSDEVDPSFKDPAVRLWDAALERDELEEDAFLGFGWWAEAQVIEDSDWLPRIYRTLARTKGRIDWDDHVVQRLISLKDNADAWRALSLMVKGAQERWSVSYWARNFHELFAATQDEDREIEESRRELAERLLEREFYEFRQYLHPTSG